MLYFVDMKKILDISKKHYRYACHLDEQSLRGIGNIITILKEAFHKEVWRISAHISLM